MTRAAQVEKGSAHEFLEFPKASSLSGAADTAAFAWQVARGDTSTLMFARAPEFSPTRLYSKQTTDGQPITGVDLSPDGQFVVFRTGEALWGRKAYNPAGLLEPVELILWVVATTPGAVVRRLGPGTGEMFAPTGARLSYKNGEDLQIVDLHAPAATPRVVRGGARLGTLEWSPDGQSLAFTQTRGGYAVLGRYRLDADRVEWLVSGADRLSGPHWSPGGKRIAYQRYPGREHSRAYDTGASEPFALEVVDVDTGLIRTLWEAPGPAMFPWPDDVDTALRWLDDQRLSFHSEHDGWGRLYAISVTGGAPRPYTPQGCEIANSALTADAQVLAVHNCPDLDTRYLSSFDPSTGQQRDVETSDAFIADVEMSGGRYAAFTGGDADSPPLLRVLDLHQGKIVRAERVADYGYRHRFVGAPPKLVSFAAADGNVVHGQLFLPREPGRHPAIVWYHGGPYQQTFAAHQGYFYAINRQLSELGYVVLSVNYRGSEGYGRDAREHPQRAWRGASEALDAGAAGHWLAARADVDAARIGAWGGSYGGLMTLQSLARYPEIFKAGVALYPLVDWSYSSPNSGWWDPSSDFGVSDATRRQAFESSPVAFLDRWSSPLMLYTGDTDIYVDVAHTIDLTQRLRERGVEVRSLVLPNESHGFVLHSTQVRLWNEMTDFFARHLGGPRPGPYSSSEAERTWNSRAASR